MDSPATARVLQSTANAPAKLFVLPIGVITVTFLALCVAPTAIAQLTLTVVEVAMTPVQVIPLPEKFTAVAPVRLEPVRITGTVVLCVPAVGLIEASAGPCTVTEMLLLVPAGLFTVTLCVPSEAVDPPAMVNVAVSAVELVTLIAVTVIPAE